MLLSQESPEQPSHPLSISGIHTSGCHGDPHWRSTLSSPSQVRPGATPDPRCRPRDTLLSPSPPPPFPLHLGYYLAFPVGLPVEGLVPRVLVVMNYSWGKEDFAQLQPPAKGPFQGFPLTAWPWGPMPLSSFSVVPRSWCGAATRPCASSTSSWEQGLGCQ